MTAECTATSLLLLSAAAFLLFSAAIAALSVDGRDAGARVPPPLRYTPRALCGVGAAALVLVMPECDGEVAAAAVPLLMLVAASFEFWALPHACQPTLSEAGSSPRAAARSLV